MHSSAPSHSAANSPALRGEVGHLPASRRWRVRGQRAVVLLFLALCTTVAAFAQALPEERIPFKDCVLPIPAKAVGTIRPLRLEHLAQPVDIEISLKMRHFEQFQDRVRRGERVPQFLLERDYLPTPAEYEAVKKWLVEEGFTITQTDRTRLSVFARGAVAQLRRSMQVEMAEVTVEGRDYTAAVTHPNLPKHLAASILGVNGLQPYLHMRKHSTQPSPRTNSQPATVSRQRNPPGVRRPESRRDWFGPEDRHPH